MRFYECMSKGAFLLLSLLFSFFSAVATLLRGNIIGSSRSLVAPKFPSRQLAGLLGAFGGPLRNGNSISMAIHLALQISTSLISISEFESVMHMRDDMA